MRKSVATLMMCFGLAGAGALRADLAGVTPCSSNTLAFYEGLTAAHPCSVGILLFSNFTFSKSGSGASETATDIMLNPFANGDSLGGGFSFSRANPDSLDPAPAFTVGAGQTASYIIDWLYIIDPGPVGSGADLGMDPPFGDVVITQDYCLDSDFRTTQSGGLGCSNQKALRSLSVDVANPNASIIFHPPAQSYASVRTIIDLNALDSTESSGFDSVTANASVAPEPVYGAMVFAGLLGMAALRRYRKPGH